MRSRAPLVATVILLLVSGVMATPHSPGCGETTAFAAPQRPYVAFRRLEAENQKSGRQGWLDVRTELGTDGLLTVEVLDEGGSDYIRNKVPARRARRRAAAHRYAFGRAGSVR